MFQASYGNQYLLTGKKALFFQQIDFPAETENVLCLIRDELRN